MARYIDADKIDFSPLKDDFDRARAKVIIMGQLTADVMEVVRCKDCVMCDRFFPIKAIGEEAVETYFCTVGRGHDTKPTDFCSHGERRTDNDLSGLYSL
jgi:hypothetical protein